ncbi:MAG: Adaptive-response sensory-kinase SasA [Acidimicrobiales bacterium]|nr:MAG: HAMP domain-containing protein [Actinomycetota bacterium]MBV6508968.1 Adaptive-response sensory-kinase SasA [Acidimicrobiales bacterium]RIK08397.1 MAG: two-component sensor histidine kinase [Acidobacteriota bacterium]
MTRRLLLSYLALTVLVLVVLEIPLGLEFAHRGRDELISEVERDASAMAGFVEDMMEAHSAAVAAGEQGADASSGEASVSAELQRIAESYQADTGGRVVIVDQDGLALADSSPPQPGERYFDTRPEVAAALSGEVSTGIRPSETLDERLVYVAVPVASGGIVYGAVRITYPTAEVDARIRDNWLRLAAIAAVTLLLASGIGFALARSVTAPLRHLEAAAGELGRGDLGARAPTDSGPPEVRALSQSFNDMAGRLADLMESQESFVAEASHQLRSPLTALRLRLENLEQSVVDDDAESVEAARREVARLSRLVDGLLSLARAGRTSAAATAEPVEVFDLLAERATAWQPLAEEQNVTIRSESGDLTINATRDRLVQMVDNLVANAIEASVDGCTTTLTAQPVGEDVEIHVIDEGPGLTEEERTHAFDRFWRASRQPGQLGGTGLGLAIVRKLARAEGGDAELRQAPGGGIDAVVRLPSK